MQEERRRLTPNTEIHNNNRDNGHVIGALLGRAAACVCATGPSAAVCVPGPWGCDGILQNSFEPVPALVLLKGSPSLDDSQLTTHFSEEYAGSSVGAP
ncbi:unnamed protein product [Boreogadus saida]